MTSENSEEIFQLIKDDIPKENTNPARTITCSHNWLFINRGVIKELWLLVLFFLINSEQLFSIYFFLPFRLLHFFCLWSPLWFFYFPQKIFFQNDLALQNLKCDWFISFIQVGRNRTYPIFQILVHQVCMNLLFYAYTSYKFKRI